MMVPADIPHVLFRLGELAAEATDLHSPVGLAAIRRFQKTAGLGVDGVIGPKTIGSLEHYRTLLDHAPAGCGQLRSWRFTNYYLAEERLYAPGTVPIFDGAKQIIGRVSAAAFAKLSLEGSGFLRDGRLVNVSGAYVPVVPSDGYAGVAALAESNGWLPRKAGYAGIRVREGAHTLDTTEWTVTHALAFKLVVGSERGIGYGSAGKRACVPFRTAATDTGEKSRHDPRYRATGGTIPRGTSFWIPEFVGMVLPDKTIHDGMWLANDTGSGIEGNQCDLFVGVDRLRRSVAWPVPSSRGYLWYNGIEARIPCGYEFGD